MLRILVLSLLVCACGEVGAVEESHQGGLGTAAAVPPPSPECTSGYSSITAHQAAKNIAEQYCISLGQDYDSLCMAPVVARFCPDIAACQQNLCLDKMDTLGACMQIFPPSPDCAVLFPADPATLVEHVAWIPPHGRHEHNVAAYAGLGFIAALADYSFVDGIPVSIPVGASISGLRLRLRGPSGSGTGYGTNTTLSARRSNGDGTASTVGRIVVPTPAPATWQTYSIALPSSVRVQDGESFEFLLYLGTADVAVSGVGVVTI